MQKICFYLCVSVLLLGWVTTFLANYWRHFPERALFRGFYRYDDRQPLPDAVTRNRNLAFLYASSETLEGSDPVGCEFLFTPLLAADTNHDSRISTGICPGEQYVGNPSVKPKQRIIV